MFIDKWRPLFENDEAMGADSTETTDTSTQNESLNTRPVDGPGSSRSELRKQLEKSADTVRKAAEKTERDDKGRFSRARERMGADDEGADTSTSTESAGDASETASQVKVPEAFGKELGGSWATVPPAWQAAIAKREADMQKGVDELKAKQADIDKALAPHMNAIRQNGHTPAQAINQLFAWFQALSVNPNEAFPALAKSFNFDLAKALPKTEAAADTKAAAGDQPEGEVPPALQAYISKLESNVTALKKELTDKIGGLEANYQRENDTRTNEVLRNWSKDKAHFESVRGLMAQMIQSGAVPLKDGQVDLDGAYEMAIYANPEIRAKVLAEQQAKAEADRKAKAAAEEKKRQEEVQKARKAGVSLGGGAPGETGAGVQGKRGKGKSVRESIMEAREELSS